MFLFERFLIEFYSNIDIWKLSITYMARMLTCPRGQVTEIVTCPPGLLGQVGQGGNP